MNNPEPIPLQERIYLKRVRQFFGNAGGNVAVACITAMIAVFIMLDAGVSWSGIGWWLALLMVAVGLVLLVEVKFEEVELTTANATRWLQLRMAGGGLVSLMYGVLVFFYPPDAEAHHIMFVVMILIALLALCATGFAVMPAYTYLVSLVTIVPMLIYLLIHASAFNLGLAFTLLVIWGVLINKARLVSASAIRALEVTEQLKAEIHDHELTRQQLDHMVNHDFLTGLPNRKHLLERLRELLKRKQNQQLDFAVLYLDLDGFKAINDQRGHAMGDWLLKTVSSRIREALDTNHLLARMGGDEFIILVSQDPAVDQQAEINALIRQIRQALQTPLHLPDGHQASIGISIGVAQATADHHSAQSIIQQADQAMYADKNRGRSGAA